ncbi:hypothetical protein SAE02_70240 [Skermanella aerolata]|uniref:Uncharacterized protein n=1 Tax=Skermanella aerolata TaxID=393310 RepID=A0A512E2F9_9PROT|nr:hypothetical protein N826_30670 [Skermanella aerolata KACC 11604]GEO42876.1 hypothetical protein SAE02_70240 [Skermanella aerolata]
MGETQMGISEQSSKELREAEQRIEWVLKHSGMSVWLKTALQAAQHRDSVHVLNDLEILCLLLRQRSQATITAMLDE